MKFCIIVSQFNKKISGRLLAGAEKALKKAADVSWDVIEVPGAFEIPMTAQKIIDAKKYDGIIALGCVMRGETDHYRAICDGVTYGIQKVSIENRVPIMFGVLMCENRDQALERSGENPKKNKGYECAVGLMKIMRVI